LNLRGSARVLGRHKLLLAAAMAAGVCMAIIVREQTVPRYEAESQIILDVRPMTILKLDAVASGLSPEPEVVRTEMDVIGSRAIAERVLDHMSPADVRQLADDGTLETPLSRFYREIWPDMVAAVLDRVPALEAIPDIRSWAQKVTRGSNGGSQLPNRDELVGLLLSGLKVSNDGRSYTIHIGFASAHPQLAATLANLYAEQYLENQLDLKTAQAKRANEWLNQRIVELRRDLADSETAVEAYRRTAGVLGNKDGTSMAQQLSDLNTQLAAARSQRIDAESRLRTMQGQLRNGGDLEALSDVLSSEVVQTLRAKQAELKRQQAQISSQYTAKYPNAKSVMTDIAALQQQISEEVSRIVKNLANQVEIARGREQSLQADIARLEVQFGKGGDAMAKLQELQRHVDANRAAYDAYLNRLKEITEQQQLQAPDAHLITPATRPGVPAYPRNRPLLALGLALGGAFGVALAFLRDSLDQRLRSIGQVEEATGLPVLALVPSLPRFRMSRPENYVLGRRGSHFHEALRSTWAGVMFARTPAGETSQPALLLASFRRSRRRHRSLSDGTVVLVTSSVPNEGKTAFCLSMARSLALDGHKVLLIDADLRRPGVARSFGGSRAALMQELLDGKIGLQDAVRIDERSGAHYLAGHSDDAHPQDILNSIRTEIVLDRARQAYDIILVDAPPILVAADAAIVAKFCDRCLFFVRWGATSRESVVNALRRLVLYKVKVSGIVLSHVNLRKHAQYASGEGYYRPYGRTAKLPPPARA
jgi:capsular exopolysaccharide synthesis family protein